MQRQEKECTQRYARCVGWAILVRIMYGLLKNADKWGKRGYNKAMANWKGIWKAGLLWYRNAAWEMGKWFR